MTRLSLLLGTFLLLGACNSQKTSSTQSSAPAPTVVAKNSIIFLFFEIEKEADGLEKVKLTDTKIAEGFVKNASLENKAPNPGNLYISLLGNNGEVVEERIIEDPLNPLLEVYAEEGLSKNKLNLKKAHFSLRFNQKGEISSVKVEKITEQSKNHLITLKL